MTAPSLLSVAQYAEYRQNLQVALVDRQVSEGKQAEILAYADNLQQNEVPIIFDQPHLAALLGYELDYIQILSTCQQDFYKEYRIPKRNGKMRIIHEPMPNLKEIQTWILDNILLSPGALHEVSPVAMAFMPQRSIIDNAACHVGKRTVICMDLKDFFSNVRYIQVYLIFNNLGYGKDVSGMLAHLCTLDGALPQGAPTSPMLSNLILSEADESLLSYCTERNIAYTRYADDLTFSTDRHIDYGQLLGKVNHVLHVNSEDKEMREYRQVLKRMCLEQGNNIL